MFTNNKILILGFARSGYEAAKFLAKRNNEVILNDMKTDHEQEKIDELESLGVKIVLGSHPDDLLDESFDYLIKNPGVPIDHKYVLKARELGVEVINEVEMAYSFLNKDTYLVFLKDGSVNFINMENRMNFEYNGKFEFNLDEYYKVTYLPTLIDYA